MQMVLEILLLVAYKHKKNGFMFLQSLASTKLYSVS